MQEREALQLLGQRNVAAPLPCRIFFVWDLTRGETQEILKSFDRDRKLKTTFANLIGVTRFKTLGGNRLIATLCPTWRMKPGNWDHHKEWFGMDVQAQTWH